MFKKLKTFLIAATIINVVTVLFWAFSPRTNIPDPIQPIEVDLGEPINSVEFGQQNKRLPAIVKEVNQRNEAIKNFQARTVIQLWHNTKKTMLNQLNGFLAYEKQNRFRMTIHSFFGEELDIGSNEEIFWYWSARDPEPGLHWAKNENFHKTRLKTPFTPWLFRVSLGLEILDETDLQIILENEDKIQLVYKTISGSNEPLLKHILIDTGMKTVTGVMITDLNNNPLMVSQIANFQNGFPRDIWYFWKEEDRTMRIIFKQPFVNYKISGSRWSLPNYEPKIEMID